MPKVPITKEQFHHSPPPSGPLPRNPDLEQPGFLFQGVIPQNPLPTFPESLEEFKKLLDKPVDFRSKKELDEKERDRKEAKEEFENSVKTLTRIFVSEINYPDHLLNMMIENPTLNDGIPWMKAVILKTLRLRKRVRKEKIRINH